MGTLRSIPVLCMNGNRPRNSAPPWRILALDTPATLKQSIGADTVVTVKTPGDTARLADLLTSDVEGVTRTRQVDGGLQLHMQGNDRLVPRIVLSAERGGFDLRSEEH